jgi:hypothetical protein
MQGTAYVGILTAHQDGPRGRPLEQAPPRSRTRSSSSGFHPVRGATPSSNGLRLVRGATLSSSGPVPLEGTLPLERVPSRSRVRPALGWDPPRSRARRTRALAPYLGI